MMKKYKSLVLILGIIILLVVTVVLLNNDKKENNFLFGSDQYYFVQTEYLKTIDFNLDLTNPEAELGRKIEINDGCYLEITSLDLLDNGQYDICFKSIGNTLDGLNIVYTANYYTHENDQISITSNTDFISNGGEKWYHSSYKEFKNNGDSFGFSIENQKVKNKKNCLIEISNLNYIKFIKK